MKSANAKPSISEVFSLYHMYNSQNAFGRKTHTKGFETSKGIFGVFQGYYGTVGRGTLHLHIILYLKGALSWEIKELLKNEDFWDRVKAFKRANFRAHWDKLEDKDLSKNSPKWTNEKTAICIVFTTLYRWTKTNPNHPCNWRWGETPLETS